MATPNPPSAPTSAPASQRHNRQISAMTASSAMGQSPLPIASRLGHHAVDSPSPASLSLLKSGLTPFSVPSPVSGFRTTSPHAGQLPSSLSQSQTPFNPFDTPTLLAASAVLHDPLHQLDGMATETPPPRPPPRDHRAELKQAISSLREQPSRISPRSIERVARQLDLDFDSNASLNGKPSLSIGGTNFVLELELEGDRIKDVTVEHGDEMSAYFDDIKSVLKSDLILEHSSHKLDSSIEPFADHLAWLSRMDRLSDRERFPCYEAIENLHRALHTIWESECQLSAPERVLRSGHGLPELNRRGDLGLRLSYQPDRRRKNGKKLVTSKQSLYKAVDPNHSIRLDLEENPSTAFPSAQASQPWVADPPFLRSDDTKSAWQSSINWQYPLRPEDDPFAMSVDQTTDIPAPAKSPKIRFVATLQPSVILPQSLASAIANTMGITNLSDPDFFMSSEYFDITLVPPSTPELAQLWRSRYCSTHLEVQSVPERVRKSAGLNADKFDLSWEATYTDTGIRITTLPFSHPKQIIELLPIFRQFTLYGKLVQSLLNESDTHIPNDRDSDVESACSSSSESSGSDSRSDTSVHLSNRDSAHRRPKKHRAVGVTLTRFAVYNTPPQISVDSPLALALFNPAIILLIPIPGPRNKPQTIQITITVVWNGKIEVQIYNEQKAISGGPNWILTEDQIRRAVEDGEDLGVLLWGIRDKVRKSGAGQKRALAQDESMDIDALVRD